MKILLKPLKWNGKDIIARHALWYIGLKELAEEAFHSEVLEYNDDYPVDNLTLFKILLIPIKIVFIMPFQVLYELGVFLSRIEIHGSDIGRILGESIILETIRPLAEELKRARRLDPEYWKQLDDLLEVSKNKNYGVPIRVINALKDQRLGGYTYNAVLEIIENRLDRLRRSSF